MILIKKTKIEKLVKRLASEAKKYNEAKDENKPEKRPTAAIRAWERIEGMMLAAEALGVKTCVFWNEAGSRIAMVKAGWEYIKIPQKGENDEA